MRLSRREWNRMAAGMTAGLFVPCTRLMAGRVKTADGLTLSIGTYSLAGMSVEESLTLLATIGYDAVEIAVQTGMDAEPIRMPRERRATVRQRLTETGLKLTSLMENLVPASDDRQHAASMDRLRRVMEMAHDLAPDQPPLVQTILGGGQWEAKKQLFCDRLGDWAKLAEEMRVVLAIKPHRMQAMSRPSEAIWLIRQLGDTPWLRMVYDYGHYIYRDMPLEATVAESLPYTALVVVKDTIVEGGKTRFALAGATGTIDYPKLLRLLYDGGYRHGVCCEVSAQIWKQPGYDPSAVAKTCYQNMAAAFQAAGVPRVSRRAAG